MYFYAGLLTNSENSVTQSTNVNKQPNMGLTMAGSSHGIPSHERYTKLALSEDDSELSDSEDEIQLQRGGKNVRFILYFKYFILSTLTFVLLTLY